MAYASEASTPLCRCRTLYLGASVPTLTKNGLAGIQEPLRERYPVDNTVNARGSDSWLSIWSNGILIEYVAGSNDNSTAVPSVSSDAGHSKKVFLPIDGLHYCAAVRYVSNIYGPGKQALALVHPDFTSNVAQTSQSLDIFGRHLADAFLPLDSPIVAASDQQQQQQPPVVNRHPPIFAAMLRRTEGVRVLECHAFICTSPAAANALVRCCFHAYADSMYLKLSGLLASIAPRGGSRMKAIEYHPSRSADRAKTLGRRSGAVSSNIKRTSSIPNMSRRIDDDDYAEALGGSKSFIGRRTSSSDSGSQATVIAVNSVANGKQVRSHSRRSKTGRVNSIKRRSSDRKGRKSSSVIGENGGNTESARQKSRHDKPSGALTKRAKSVTGRSYVASEGGQTDTLSTRKSRKKPPIKPRRHHSSTSLAMASATVKDWRNYQKGPDDVGLGRRDPPNSPHYAASRPLNADVNTIARGSGINSETPTDQREITSPQTASNLVSAVVPYWGPMIPPYGFLPPPHLPPLPFDGPLAPFLHHPSQMGPVVPYVRTPYPIPPQHLPYNHFVHPELRLSNGISPTLRPVKDNIIYRSHPTIPTATGDMNGIPRQDGQHQWIAPWQPPGSIFAPSLSDVMRAPMHHQPQPRMPIAPNLHIRPPIGDRLSVWQPSHYPTSTVLRRALSPPARFNLTKTGSQTLHRSFSPPAMGLNQVIPQTSLGIYGPVAMTHGSPSLVDFHYRGTYLPPPHSVGHLQPSASAISHDPHINVETGSSRAKSFLHVKSKDKAKRQQQKADMNPGLERRSAILRSHSVAEPRYLVESPHGTLLATNMGHQDRRTHGPSEGQSYANSSAQSVTDIQSSRADDISSADSRRGNKGKRIAKTRRHDTFSNTSSSVAAAAASMVSKSKHLSKFKQQQQLQQGQEQQRQSMESFGYGRHRDIVPITAYPLDDAGGIINGIDEIPQASSTTSATPRRLPRYYEKHGESQGLRRLTADRLRGEPENITRPHWTPSPTVRNGPLPMPRDRLENNQSRHLTSYPEETGTSRNGDLHDSGGGSASDTRDSNTFSQSITEATTTSDSKSYYIKSYSASSRNATLSATLAAERMESNKSDKSDKAGGRSSNLKTFFETSKIIRTPSVIASIKGRDKRRFQLTMSNANNNNNNIKNGGIKKLGNNTSAGLGFEGQKVANGVPFYPDSISSNYLSDAGALNRIRGSPRSRSYELSGRMNGQPMSMYGDYQPEV